MRQPNDLQSPRALPEPVLELCAQLEEHGITTFSQGEGLLADLRAANANVDSRATQAPGSATRSLLCAGEAAQVLSALPRAVVTGEGARRLTQATAAGPIDLLCSGEAPIEDTLLSFGLGPLALGFRPANGSWCDPADQLSAFLGGRLEAATPQPNPFAIAPRRYWIAARLMAEHGLEATPELLASARNVLPEVAERLPQAAPARREISRILAAPTPESGLAFLRESGVTPMLFPGTLEANERRVAALPAMPAIRWAAWLRGSATASALVRLRVPHALARRVERLQATHPVDRVVDSVREAGFRKLLGRLAPEEVDALLCWRRIEIADSVSPAERSEAEARLAAIEARIVEIRTAEERTGLMRALAIDGRAVMDELGLGPGRHVGQALAHLARFVEAHPDSNQRPALEAELVDWAAKNLNVPD